MSDLALMIDSIAAEASTMCTQCLIDAVTAESDELKDKVRELADATIQRCIGADGRARYDAAFAEVMSSVLLIAVCTRELSLYRAVAWMNTGQSGTVTTSLN